VAATFAHGLVVADGAVAHAHRPITDVKDAAAVQVSRVAADSAVAHAHGREAGTAVVADATTAIG